MKLAEIFARSVTLSSDILGIVAKMDLIEGEDGTVTPVDSKKGKRPPVAEGGGGAIWYAGSRERVRIALDETLRARTRGSDLRRGVRQSTTGPRHRIGACGHRRMRASALPAHAGSSASRAWRPGSDANSDGPANGRRPRRDSHRR